ncbi:hypothetical protein LTR95_012863, partial [Oleoguttula sp. CCFEE 5521]
MSQDPVPFTTETFEYDALDDTRTYIRLLQLQKATRDGSIECNLRAWPLGHCPLYTAISYTWGSPDKTTVILVNGLSLTVRQNCADVLSQASWYGDEFHWVDAICIDQKNEDEKSHQVQVMREIYGRAERVLACVGPHSHDGDSRFLLKILKDHESTLLAVVDELDTGITSSWPMFRPPRSNAHQTLRLARSVAWRLRFTIEMHRRIFAAVHAMLSRTYFERVWVAQELYMASKPILLCGADQCTMAALEGLLAISSISDFGRGRSDGAWLNKHFYRYRTTKVWRRMFHAVTHHLDDAGELKKSGLPTLLHYGGSRNRLPETSLSRMVQTIHPLHCSDPRDIIYATLGLLDPKVASRIAVDYHKTTFGLAIEVIPMFFDEVAAQLELDGEIYHGGSQAGTLLRMLRPSDDDAHYSRAIAIRTHREQQHVQGSAPLSRDRTRTKVNHWSGHRLWCFGSTWRMGVNEPTTIANTTETLPGSHPGLVKVGSKRGHLLAILPNNVRNGDWLLQSASPWQLVCPGLVLRSTAGGTLAIISTAVFIRGELVGEGPEGATTFTINFDTEDLGTCLFHFTSFWRRP